MMLKRCAYVQGFVLIIFALWIITLTAESSNGADSEWENLIGSDPQSTTAKPSNGADSEWESVTESDSQPTPPPVAVPIPPSSASTGALDQGRTIAVISNTDLANYKLFREWAGQDDSIQTILEPSSLDDLGKKLETLGRERKISKLIFMGHGVRDARGVWFISTPQTQIDAFITEASFKTLAQNRPELSKAFLPGAHLMFFNCMIGKNKPFLEAAGDAFFDTYGGFVVANTDATRFVKVRDQDGNLIIKWVDSPDWWKYPFVLNTKENITRWFGEGWVTIETPKGSTPIEPDWTAAGCPGPGAELIYTLHDTGPYAGGSSTICRDRSGRQWLSPNGQRFRLVKSIKKGSNENPPCFWGSKVVTDVNPPHDMHEAIYEGNLCPAQ